MNESHWLFINKEKHQCKGTTGKGCGCTLYHYDNNAPNNKEWHVCNGCGLTYETEKG